MDFLFIHGAPGTGKSSLAAALQKRTGGPWFEFGWIPEFRQTRDRTLIYEEEESLAFENLTLILKNYVRHGFHNILVSDLRDPKIRLLPRVFSRHRWLLVTLWVDDEKVLKSRVLDQTRSSGYRDWEAALRLNRKIQARPLMTNEVRLNSAQTAVELLAETVLRLAAERDARPRDAPAPRPPLVRRCVSVGMGGVRYHVGRRDVKTVITRSGCFPCLNFHSIIRSSSKNFEGECAGRARTGCCSGICRCCR